MQQELSADERLKIRNEQAKICINEHYPDKNWEDLWDKEPLTDCTFACIMRNIGIVSKFNDL